MADSDGILMGGQMFIGGHFFDSRTDGLYPFRKDFLECNLADKAIQTYTAICYRVSISRLGMIGAGSNIARTFRSQRT